MIEHVCGKQGFLRGGPESVGDVCPACTLEVARRAQNIADEKVALDQPVTRRELLFVLDTLAYRVPGTMLGQRLRRQWGLP